MNYIKELQDTVKDLNIVRSNTMIEIFNLERYLNSDKFRCGNELDSYVNVKDVLARLAEIKSAVNAGIPV